jgi:transcriptional regulator with XRE-family HTH domain
VNQDSYRSDEVVGMLLGDAREAAGLSQPDVARRIGASQSRIAQLELGRRRLLFTEALVLAELYGIELRELDPRGKSMPPGPRRRRPRADRRRETSPD